MIENYLLAVAFAGVVCMCVHEPPASAGDSQSEPDVKLNRYFQGYLEKALSAHPFMSTGLGDHRFDAQLDDVSAGARERWDGKLRQVLEELPRAVDYAKLSRPVQIDYEIFRDSLLRELWQSENVRAFERDPRVYGGYASESVFLLFAQSSLPLATNVAHALARMEQVPRVLATARENLRSPLRVVTETAIKQNRGAIGFYEKDLFEMAGKSESSKELKASAARVIDALRVHQQFLEKELLPRASDDWRLGKEKFARKFELEVAAGITADEALALAEAEFQRVSRDLYVLARQLWSSYFPKQPLPPVDAAGRRETVQCVLGEIARDHARPQDLVKEARATVANIKKFIRTRGVLTLPDPDRCKIVEMPEFLRGNSVADLRFAPPLDPDTPSIYSISPPPKDWPVERVKSFVEEYNRRMLQILTIHEAYPGHYVQFAYANRQPSLIRRICGSDVYAEGWAVYSEQMMLDEGYGNGDLALRMNALKFYLRTVGNAILDHKMHCDGMSDEEALRFLTEDAFQSDGEARLKIIRSKQSSVQLSYYFVGKMAFMRLREQVQRELGKDFDLGRFHEAILELGAVPVKYLPELVRMKLKMNNDGTAGREVRTVSGWTVHVSKVLLDNEAEATAKAMDLLKVMLDDIVRVVPGPAVAELQKVPLYFSPEYPKVRPRAEFHPGEGWLKEQGRDPVMVKGVEFTNVRIFEAEVRRMPNFALHELAHAYHDRVLGFDRQDIKTAYQHAKDSKSYDKVERWHGNGHTNTFERAYAMTDHKEYFAETTEAFFGRNDFFPFTRAELAKHDPEMFALLEKLWSGLPKK